ANVAKRSRLTRFSTSYAIVNERTAFRPDHGGRCRTNLTGRRLVGGNRQATPNAIREELERAMAVITTQPRIGGRATNARLKRRQADSPHADHVRTLLSRHRSAVSR